MLRRLIFVLAVVVGLSAAAMSYEGLQVKRTDGSTTTIALADDVHIGVADGILTLSSVNGDVSIPLAELQNWVYVENLGVADAGADAVQVRMTDSAVELSGLTPAAEVALYDTEGRLAGRVAAGEDGSAILSTAHCAPGVYVLAYGNQSIKIAIR